MTDYNIYTGIGSRETPEPILELMFDLGFKLSTMGWVLRSGGAEGADAAFEEGARYSRHYLYPGFMEIYIPWPTFNGLVEDQDHIQVRDVYTIRQAEQKLETFKKVHQLSDPVRKLHVRNVFQVLGHDLNTPTKMVLFWARPNHKYPRNVMGGTNTAIRIAKQHNIPTFNLYDDEVRQKVIEKFEL